MCSTADMRHVWNAGKPGQVWHSAEVKEVGIPKPKDGQVLVKLQAAAMNHREVFIRQCKLSVLVSSKWSARSFAYLDTR